MKKKARSDSETTLYTDQLEVDDELIITWVDHASDDNCKAVPTAPFVITTRGRLLGKGLDTIWQGSPTGLTYLTLETCGPDRADGSENSHVWTILENCILNIRRFPG